MPTRSPPWTSRCLTGGRSSPTRSIATDGVNGRALPKICSRCERSGFRQFQRSENGDGWECVSVRMCDLRRMRRDATVSLEPGDRIQAAAAAYRRRAILLGRRDLISSYPDPIAQGTASPLQYRAWHEPPHTA